MGISDASFRKLVVISAKYLATSGIFYYFHLAMLCKSINTALNANEFSLYTFYSVT